MKEQFDKRLVEKIKGSFENYEEPFDPQEWEKFSHAYFNKKKPKPLWLWTTLISGIAASLVIGFMFWPSVEDISHEEYASYDQELPMIESDTPIAERSLSEIDNKKDIPKIQREQKTVMPDRVAESPLTQVMDTEDQPVKSVAYEDQRKEILEEVNTNRMIAVNVEPLGTLDPTPLKKLEMAEISERGQNIISEESKSALDLYAVAPKEPLKVEEAQKMINAWSRAESPSIMEKKKEEPGVKWGVLMAPQAASNNTTGLNLGGGVMSEISLSKRLKLDIGVTYARQSLVPGQGQNVAMVMNSMPGSPSADQMQLTSAYSVNRASPLMGANMVSTVNPTYELNFANLDIPINLKYKVMDNHQYGLYLISGLSSMIYLNQSTTETFNISYVGISQANAFSSNQVQTLTTEMTPIDGESTVDLGRMLNLSFGYEYKLTNGTFMSVEPFYKLPIGNMTFVDQQFSIGGVNLRMNFQFKK